MTPVEFREYLQRGGPVLITIGRFLASLPELLPQEMADELIYLRDEAAPLPWDEVQAIVEADLAVPLDEVFDSVDPRPIVAGALAQIHVGRLMDGAEVTLKIQRPDARAQVLPQLDSVELLEDLFARTGCATVIPPRELVAELVGWADRELDLATELANVARLHNLTAGDPHQVVPRPYPELSSARVLTLESNHGVRLVDYLDDLGGGRTRGGVSGRHGLLDRRRFGESLIAAGLSQIFALSLFQADLAPGNLLVLDGNAVGFAGFGNCREVDPVVEERRMRHVSAMLSQDPEQMFSVLAGILVPSQETNLSAFRRMFLSEVRLARSARPVDLDDRGPTAAERSPAAAGIVGALRTAHRFGLRAPPDTLAVYRALIMLDTVARQMGADVRFEEVGRAILVRLQVAYAIRVLEPESMESLSLRVLDLWQDGAAHLQRGLRRQPEGDFTIETYVAESSRTESRENRRARLMVMGLLTVGGATLLVRPGVPDLLGVSIIWPIGAALLVLYVSLLVQMRRG